MTPDMRNTLFVFAVWLGSGVSMELWWVATDRPTVTDVFHYCYAKWPILTPLLVAAAAYLLFWHLFLQGRKP